MISPSVSRALIPHTSYDEEFTVDDDCEEIETVIKTATPHKQKLKKRRGRKRKNAAAREEEMIAQLLDDTEFAVPRRGSTSDRRSSNYTRANVDSHPKGGAISKDVMLHIQSDLEDKLRATVKQTDMYHIIQVHLGYVKNGPYVIIPARGEVVVSEPRKWLTQDDIQEAFKAARLSLADHQFHALLKLLSEFVMETKAKDSSSKNELKNESTEDADTITRPIKRYSPVYYKRKVNAEWFNRYLVSLRLSKRSKPCLWNEWLGAKLVKSKLNIIEKPKQFRRALAGLSYTISKLEINRMLDHIEIISEEIMNSEIEYRLNQWVYDTRYYYLRLFTSY